MTDHMGRKIEYLRLSLTERCTLQCAYCRSGEGLCPKKSELTADEFMRVAKVMAALGVNKIRLTGGEPMLRRDLPDIIASLAALPDIREIAMTTNAQHLPGQAAALKAAGLTRLNISIDSLRSDRYRELTGGNIDMVLQGIREAIQAGLLPLKLNAVLMRGVNDDEIDAFIELTRHDPVDMRFIELMPMGEAADSTRRVLTDEILAQRPWLIPLPPRYAGQPSTDYMVNGYVGRVGFISPISHKFCGDCNRVRVMSDGMLRPCLGNNMEVSLLEALKEKDDTLLLSVIRDAVYHKPQGHMFEKPEYASTKNMSRIGG